jgi:Replication initiator protein A
VPGLLPPLLPVSRSTSPAGLSAVLNLTKLLPDRRIGSGEVRTAGTSDAAWWKRPSPFGCRTRLLHGGHQEGGWSFDLKHLHAKSGSLSAFKHFAYDLREIARRQTLRGHRLVITQDPSGAERLNFASIPSIRSRSGYANAGSFLARGAACESFRAIGDRNRC